MRKTYEEISAEVAAAVDEVRDYSYFDYPAGLILGSGMEPGELMDEVHAEVEFAAIPNLAQPAVEGHGGRIVLGECAGGHLAVLSGRLHYYEGLTMYEVAFPVRVLEGIGVETLVCTTASGGLNPEFEPGEVMLHNDFLNRMGADPLRGVETDPPGARFLDLSQPYDPELNGALEEALSGAGLTVHRGVFAAESGPTYETGAEIASLRDAGADAVSMSTVPEVTVANLLGLRTTGVSLITNATAGEPVSHEEVLSVSQRAGGKLIEGLREFFERLG